MHVRFVLICSFLLFKTIYSFCVPNVIGLNIDSPQIQSGYFTFYKLDVDHRNILLEEGFLYNGYRVGVWVTRNKHYSIQVITIYLDSAQRQLKQYLYTSTGKIKSVGTYSYLPILIKDTFDYKVNNIDFDTSGIFIRDSTLLKHGQWWHYFDNGQIESEGRYCNGKKSGLWSFYNIKGELEKEEYN